MVRRVVTGVVDGKSVIFSDNEVHAKTIKAIPGQADFELWTSHASVSHPAPLEFRSSGGYLPGAGEANFKMVTFPPHAVFTSPDFDAAAAAKEMAEAYPGLPSDPDHPDKHATPTLDYVIIVDGEITLEVEDGFETVMKQGEVIVQCGAFHGWRNHTTKPVTMALVMIGARRPVE